MAIEDPLSLLSDEATRHAGGTAPSHPELGPYHLEGQPDDFVMAPNNIEAEQALLGAILINNEALFRISDVLQAHHFFDPLHQRIFHTLSELIGRGQLASPITLKTYFEDDAAMKEVGGSAYLARLAGAAPTLMNAPEYARAVFELYQRRGLMHVGEQMAITASNPEVDETPGQQIEQAEHNLYELAESGRYEGGFQSFARAVEISIQSINKAFQKGGMPGLSTGLIEMDRLLGGLHNSDLVILAGRPSMGKTALATNIAFNVARRYREGKNPDGSRKVLDGGIVAFYSLEMSAEQLATRLLAEQSGIPSNKLLKGDITSDEFRSFSEAAREIESVPLFIDDTGGLSIAALAARARRMQRQQGLDLIIVDYLQLVSAPGRRNEGRVQEVTQITQSLKSLAKDLKVPVLALAQLSRKVEDRDDKRPQLADLRESGSIEQDADVVMFVYREEYYVERTKPSETNLDKMVEWQQRMEQTHGKADVIIGKQRRGPTGTIALSFEANITRFGNLAHHDYETEDSI